MNRAKHALAVAGAFAFVVLVAPLLAQSGVTGDWDLTFQTPQGANTIRVRFVQDGGKLSGVFTSPLGELPFDGGTMTGNQLKFSVTIPLQGQLLEIAMSGMVDGPSIRGKAQFGGFGEGEWTASRVEANAPSASAAPASPAPSPSAAGASPGTGFNGRWDVTVKTQMGELPGSAELSESAGKVSGTFTGPTGTIDLSGTVEGNALKLAFIAKTPQGDVPVSLTGELDGDSIVNGKAEFGGMAGEWSAKRKQ
jgi:hypothetical protein